IGIFFPHLYLLVRKELPTANELQGNGTWRYRYIHTGDGSVSSFRGDGFGVSTNLEITIHTPKASGTTKYCLSFFLLFRRNYESI
ncbi:Os10g0318000, partial [Oryza sativa Japonica Group]